jgi:hypothetical protein
MGHFPTLTVNGKNSLPGTNTDTRRALYLTRGFAA